MSEEEQQCEKYFFDTIKRSETERFIVKLPKKSISALGDSTKMALRRFYALKRRLEQKFEVAKSYKKFMQEDHRLGHMPIVNSAGKNESTFYLLHHLGIKQESITTKFRMV